MIPDDFVQEVPAPLSHWRGQTKIAPENEALLLNKRVLRTLKTRPFWAVWAKDELREAEKLLDTLNKNLAAQGIDALLATFNQLNDEAHEFRIQMYNLRQEYKRSDYDVHREDLKKQAQIIRENMLGVKRDREALLIKL